MALSSRASRASSACRATRAPGSALALAAGLPLAFALPLALAACMREGAPPVAPVDVAVGEVADAGAPSAVASPAATPNGPRDRCTARLRAGPIKTAAGCTNDERVSKGPGLLLYPCSGDGAAEAVFGEHRFEGTVSGGALSLDLVTELDLDDGCHWETKQRIRGEWRAEPRRAKLAWSYSEGAVRGTGCFQSCKATAEIELEEGALREAP